jgi:hypothetical protein
MSAPPQTRIRHRYSRCSCNHGPVTHGGVGGRTLRLYSEMPRHLVDVSQGVLLSKSSKVISDLSETHLGLC